MMVEILVSSLGNSWLDVVGLLSEGGQCLGWLLLDGQSPFQVVGSELLYCIADWLLNFQGSYLRNSTNLSRYRFQLALGR